MAGSISSSFSVVLDAIQAYHDKHPQPFSHILEKFCSVRLLKKDTNPHTGKTSLIWDCVPFSEAEIVGRLKHEESAVRPMTSRTVNHFHTIMDILRRTAATYSDFNEFFVYNCIMSWPADGDPNDYYRDDWDIRQNLIEGLSDLNWEGDR